jgi:hypothetical protein
VLKDTNDYPLSLPRRGLRSALFRSGAGARLGETWWRPTAEAPYIREIHRRPVDMFSGIPTKFADPHYDAVIGAGSARWRVYDETITAIDDAWVEPNRCQIIGPDGRLVDQSRTHPGLPLFPSAWGYSLGRGTALRRSEAIVYDGSYSTNYYHHLIDCLPGIPFYLERTGLPPNLPLVVNRWIFDSRFFAYLRRRSPAFAQLNWLVLEPGQWLHLDRAYRLRAAPFERAAVNSIRTMYGRMSEPLNRRIFLSRDSRAFSRGISNEAAVAELLGSYGFETVYAEHLSAEDQQRTFEEATHLVALQGMGLVQQLFMDANQSHVLELMPSDRLQSEYYWQGWTLGMRFYDVQTGSAMDRRGQYSIDTARLEAGVQRMIEHPAGQRRYGETLIADVSN